ncbi:MAG: hypothetical protein AMJ90_00865 [candidate division Zixibacteria bacterium SM23_73_2]|nr:MAG: hypothetical protein AMJ90_00865 [candidate division Zixibacteria bacterium SM23_73_2]
MNTKIKKDDIVDLEVFDLAFGGRGVAKLDGMVVLVKGGIPGDRLKAKVLKKKRTFALAEKVELIKKSNLRAEPLCSHFGLCGGCKFQNLKYEHQLEYKEKQVRESLIHIGGFENPKILPILGSDNTFYYRNKMEFSFDRDEKGDLILGLHPDGRYDRVFDLKECFLQSQTSNQIIVLVRDFCRGGKLSAYDSKSHQGFFRFLVIREGKNTEEVMVNIVTHKGEFFDAQELCQRLKDKFPKVKSIVRNINKKLANIAVGEEEKVLFGERSITERLDRFLFCISANSFFQTNTLQAKKLFDKVLDLADLDGSERVLDLYSGTGTISIFLSSEAKEVLGVDSSVKACQDAELNAGINGVKNCKFILGEAKAVLSKFQSEGEKFHLVVVDPPRAGLHPKVVKSILNLKPQKIIYVSCNPATLSRDLKILCEKEYSLDEVVPIDMFPHTYHVESVAKLSRKSV